MNFEREMVLNIPDIKIPYNKFLRKNIICLNLSLTNISHFNHIEFNQTLFFYSDDPYLHNKCLIHKQLDYFLKIYNKIDNLQSASGSYLNRYLLV